MIYAIFSIDSHDTMGVGNELLYKSKKDLQFFKEKTINNTVVMGRKTADSLPFKLPNRKSIVLSNSISTHKNADVVFTLDEFMRELPNIDTDVFIIGGADVLMLLWHIVDIAYVTVFKANENTLDGIKFNSSLLREMQCLSGHVYVDTLERCSDGASLTMNVYNYVYTKSNLNNRALIKWAN